jgi:antitoxin YefM
MQVLTYSDTRARLKEVMDRVVEDCEPVIIARKRGQSVVIVSLEEWNALQTTRQLLSSPRNAERLRASIKELDAGRGVERELLEP